METDNETRSCACPALLAQDAKTVDSLSADKRSDRSQKGGACWACGAGIDAGDNYCRKCGKGQGSSIHWYYKHWGVIVLTLALGPFSLYFVWRSPVLSRNAKWVYTAVIALFTWYAARAFYGFWQFYMGMLGGMQLPY